MVQASYFLTGEQLTRRVNVVRPIHQLGYDKGRFWLGAFEVHGRIRDAWKAAGWEAGSLGYPISDEYAVPVGRRSDFQHGSITWTSATDTTAITPGT